MKRKNFLVLAIGMATMLTTTTFVGCKDYDDDITRLEDKIDANNGTSTTGLDALTTKVTNFEATSKALDAKLVQTQKDLEAANLKITEAKATGDQALVKAAEAKAAAATEAQKAATEAVETAKIYADKLNTEMVAKLAEIKAMAVKNGADITALDAAIKAISDKGFDAKIASLDSKVSALEGAAAINLSDLKSLKDDVTALRNAAPAVSKADIDALNAKIATINATLTSLAAKDVELAARLAVIEQGYVKNAALQTSLDAINLLITNGDLALGARIDALTGKVTALEGVSAAGASKAYVDAEIAKLNTTLEALNKKVAEDLAAFESKVGKVLGDNVLSITYVPTNLLNNVKTILFPYILNGNDQISAQVYEYDVVKQDVKSILVKGYADLTYKLNPSSASEAKFTIEGLDNIEVNQTYADATPIVVEKIAYTNGVLNVKAQGDLLYDKSADFSGDHNNPKADMLALHLKNKFTETGADVFGEYTQAGRAYVMQNNISIKHKDAVLADMVTLEVAKKEADIIAAFAATSSLIDVPFAATVGPQVVLSESIKPYVKYESTVGWNLSNTVPLFKEDNGGLLGFYKADFEIKYSVVALAKYIDVDSKTGAITVKGGVDAIDQTPIIKVQLFNGTKLVMSKLFKIKINNEIKREYTFDFGTVTLGAVDKDATYKFEEVLKNNNMTLAQFNAAYTLSATNGVTGIVLASAVAPETNDKKSPDRLILTVKSDIVTTVAGKVFGDDQKITLVCTANDPKAQVTKITIYAKVKVVYPTVTINKNGSMWDGSNMIITGKVGATLSIEGILANGFNFNLPGKDEATREMTFELEKDKDGNFIPKGVTIVGTSIVLTNNADGKKLIGKTVNVIAKIKYNENAAQVVETTYSPFTVLFKEPVSIPLVAKIKDVSVAEAWYLIDKSIAADPYGFSLPIYKLFNIKGSATIPNLWEAATGVWTDKMAYGIAVSYKINNKDNNLNIDENAKVDAAAGILTWNNASGDMLISDQAVIVTVKVDHAWGSVSQDVTVVVKPKGTAVPAVIPPMIPAM